MRPRRRRVPDGFIVIATIRPTWHHQRVDAVLDRMWKLYRNLSRYRKRPTPLRKLVMEQRFDQLFGTVTG